MIPFYFGQAPRQLFGAYDPPLREDRRQGVVICYPGGQEYLFSHQSLRYLARLLSETGFHVLRFDYFGTGDSAGEATECTVRTHLADISTAIDELKDTSGVSRIHLVGLRLGASLAGAAALSRTDIGRLVLWEPLVGADCASARGGSADSVVEANGLPLAGTVARGMQELDFHVSSERPPATAIVTANAGDASLKHIIGSLRTGCVEPHLLHYNGPKIWVSADELGTSGMPVKALRNITNWLADGK